MTSCRNRKDYAIFTALAIGFIALISGCANTTNNTTIDTAGIVTHKAPTEAAIEDAEFCTMGAITPLIAIQRAIDVNPDIQRLKAELKLASGTSSQDLRSPELRLLYGQNSSTTDRNRWSANNDSSTTGSVDDDSSNYGIGIRFFLPNPWTHSSIELQHKAEAETLRAELDAARHKTATAVLKIFNKLEYIRQQRKLSQQTIDIHRKKQHEINAMAAAGTITTADSITFSRRYLRALSEQAHIEMLYEDTLNSLAELLCIPNNKINLSDTQFSLLSVDISEDGINTLRVLMLRNRSDLSALAWRRIATESALKTQRAEQRPWIRHIQASYGSSSGSSTGRDTTTAQDSSDSSEFRDDDQDGDKWAVSAAISIPLPGFDKNEKERLILALNQAAQTETARIRKAEVKLRQLCLSLQRQETAEHNLKNQIKPIVKSIKDMLKQGESTSLPLDDQLRLVEDLAEARKLEIELDYRYRSNVIELDQTIGIPLFHISNSADKTKHDE